ncbi:hypothetical protein PIB30_017377 [Stylosanthes scabra]|uniref:RRM domain-containing protein n=1 Tax=Stylosanthes scabra TaxID=79078 RepID=A0ABU6V6M0_9FABA|nr:hypothetical protein [Stylosanthes scabra]
MEVRDMRDFGVRGLEGYKRGKHWEDSGYAGWKNKGMSVGLGTLGEQEGNHGVGQNVRVGNYEQSVYTIFLDNLPGARRTIQGMNGRVWEGRKIHVTMSRFRRNTDAKNDRNIRKDRRKEKEYGRWIVHRKRKPTQKLVPRGRTLGVIRMTWG